MSSSSAILRPVVCCLLLLSATLAHAKLSIVGADQAVEDTLRAFITVDDLPCSAPRWWIRRAWQRTEDEARQALETLGFYQSRIESSLEWDESCWQVSLKVRHGPRARMGRVDIAVEGPLGDEAAMQAVLEEQALRTGRRFTHQRYEDAKARMLAVAEDFGYFDARFSRARVAVDPIANTADIALTLAGGPRYRIGDIEILQDELRPELINRYVRFRSGDPFAAEALARTYVDLLASQYFDRVLLSPLQDARADGVVPIRIEAGGGPRRTLLLGAGYSTDSGPRTRADARYRRLNDRGHRASFQALVSGIQGEIKGEYRLPYGDPARESLFLESGMTYDETDVYKNRNWNAGGGRTHQRTRDWTETNYLSYRVDDYALAGDDGHSQLLLVGTSWSRKNLTDVPRPVKGYGLSLDVRGASRLLLSDTDVLQTTARVRYIVPVTERLRLLSRAAFGWTRKQKFADLPPTLRFYAGGDASVRGYDFESLGPEVDGEVVGGRKLLTGSLELDHAIRQDWSIALFGDIGSAYNDSPDFSRGVGVGLRWYSPVGPLRIDLAHPLDDPNRAFRIHVSLGPDL